MLVVQSRIVQHGELSRVKHGVYGVIYKNINLRKMLIPIIHICYRRDGMEYRWLWERKKRRRRSSETFNLIESYREITISCPFSFVIITILIQAWGVKRYIHMVCHRLVRGDKWSSVGQLIDMERVIQLKC